MFRTNLLKRQIRPHQSQPLCSHGTKVVGILFQLDRSKKRGPNCLLRAIVYPCAICEGSRYSLYRFFDFAQAVQLHTRQALKHSISAPVLCYPNAKGMDLAFDHVFPICSMAFPTLADALHGRLRALQFSQGVLVLSRNSLVGGHRFSSGQDR